MNTSLIITTHDRAELLSHALRRIAELTAPSELIVVDDGGDDNTEAVVEACEVRCPTRYVYTNHPGRTLCSHARNVGLKLAECEYVVTAEPELVWRSDVIAQFAELAPAHPDKVISSGRVHFAGKGWRPDGLEDVPHGVQVAQGWVAPHVALWKRDWLYEVGGWDEGFPNSWGWDDTDLLTRVSVAGHGQYIAREIEAIHLYHGLGGDTNRANEDYFLAKKFPADQVANAAAILEGSWGQPIPRD